MPLFELGNDHLTAIDTTTFANAKVKERQDLQRLLRKQIEIIVPDAMVLAEEFADWDDSKRSIDLLVLDRDACLVVVELKRTEDGGHMELQALRYAAMISAMTFEQAVEAHGRFLKRMGKEDDPKESILSFLNWEEPDEDRFGQDVRIVLASADFSKELTTAILWLNDRDLDIRCVRMVPYQHDGKTILDVQQIIPLPEAEAFQVRVKEKSQLERDARKKQNKWREINRRFWTGLLEKANAISTLHENVTPSTVNWVGANAHGANYNYATPFGDCRVELYLCRSNKADNKAMFNDIAKHKADIERMFGGELSWQRMENNVASRIAAKLEGVSPNDESTWADLQDKMVDKMQRLEAALRPYAQKYREGGSPNGG